MLDGISHPLGCAAVILVTGFLLTRLVFRATRLGCFLCQFASFAGFTAMLMVAKVSPFANTPPVGGDLTFVTLSVFKIVWWLSASWLLAGFARAVLVFKRQPKETQFLQDLCGGVIYIAGILGIIAYVFDMPISGLLAASGVVAIVLGLALQSTLGDVFSGIVLNLAKPYRMGDWVILDGGLEGRVVETNWRAAQLLTRSNDLATIPNSIISKAKLINASEPTEAHGVSIIIRLEPSVSPLRGVAILETALLSCNLIRRVPAAFVRTRSLDAVALECDLTFFFSPIEQEPDVRNEVFDRVYRHCASAGIRLAPPAESAMILPAQPLPHEAGTMPRRLLERLPIFTPLSDDERLALAPKMKRSAHKAGDVILEQGVVAGALFILSSGVLAGIRHTGVKDEEVLRYAPGDCFGQAGVLTGVATAFRVQALISSVVYEIAKNDIAPILEVRPTIVAELGRIIARREEAWKDRLTGLQIDDKHAENLATRFADRIRDLFALPK